jgi:hypothetical protein
MAPEICAWMVGDDTSNRCICANAGVNAGLCILETCEEHVDCLTLAPEVCAEIVGPDTVNRCLCANAGINAGLCILAPTTTADPELCEEHDECLTINPEICAWVVGDVTSNRCICANAGINAGTCVLETCEEHDECLTINPEICAETVGPDTVNRCLCANAGINAGQCILAPTTTTAAPDCVSNADCLTAFPQLCDQDDIDGNQFNLCTCVGGGCSVPICFAEGAACVSHVQCCPEETGRQCIGTLSEGASCAVAPECVTNADCLTANAALCDHDDIDGNQFNLCTCVSGGCSVPLCFGNGAACVSHVQCCPESTGRSCAGSLPGNAFCTASTTTTGNPALIGSESLPESEQLPEQAPCSPATCVSLGLSCGMASDGCGATLDCGACPTTPSPVDVCVAEGERCVNDGQCCAGLCRGRGCQDRGRKTCQAACA